MPTVSKPEIARGAPYTTPVRRSEGRTYRLCANYTQYNVCNWAVPSDDPNPLCTSCRLTQVIPDLSRSFR